LIKNEMNFENFFSAPGKNNSQMERRSLPQPLSLPTCLTKKC
jgi:hypothetical protein